MFSLSYIGSELRRRRGRTLLTALGLGLGVGLVVTVAALSRGLDRAQDEVLRPLTGVGTDLSVSRPLNLKGGGNGGPPDLSARERRQLQRENRGSAVDIGKLGTPGEKFSRTDFVAGTQLSFPASEARRIAGLDGVADAAASLTVDALTLSGKVPERGARPEMAPSGTAPPDDLDIESITVTGVDPTKPSLAPVTPG